MRAELRASQVGPGAVLELDGRTRRVIGTLRLDQDGTEWGEHCIETSRGPHEWLAIRPRGGPKVVHWTPRYDLFSEPDPSGMAMDGRDWTLEVAGTVTYTAQGATGTGPRGTCEYVEFADTDGLLAFESFDGGVWEISVGRFVDPALLRGYREGEGD